ncbi:MAG: translation initiation factor, partial [Acidimicrobiaceae bacterium]
QAKESRRKASNVSIKEMKYRPKIGAGDFDTKTRKVEKFLAEGHKVKVTIMFRGRETQHPELGRRILDHVADRVVHLARVEAMPKLDGRNMIMVLAPDKKAKALWDAQRKAEAGDGEANGTGPVAAEPHLDDLETDDIELAPSDTEGADTEAETEADDAEETDAADTDADDVA